MCSQFVLPAMLTGRFDTIGDGIRGPERRIHRREYLAGSTPAVCVEEEKLAL